MDTVRAAFRDECARLEGVLRELDAADLDRLTPCPPWAVRDLLASGSGYPGDADTPGALDPRAVRQQRTANGISDR
ncbi:hypothetical protein GCM10027452_41010 [Micromonospora halotolerans]